jgi:tetratricopeptide (TPR) repeat protein
MARRKVSRTGGRKRAGVRLQPSLTRPGRKIGILLGVAMLCVVAVVVGLAVRLRATRSPLSLAEPTIPVARSRASAPPSAGSTDAPPTFPRLSLDASLTPEEQDRALREEQLEAAHRLVAAFPGDANGSFLLGMAYLEQGNAVEATAHLTKSLELQPTRADACDHLGQIALLAGEYQRASERFRQALERDPKTPSAHFRLARALAFLGDSEQAIAEARKDIELSPQAGESYALLGETYLQLQDYASAKTAYEQAIQVQPGLSKCYYGLSVVCARLGQPEESRAYQQRFRDIEAQDRQAGRHWRQAFDSLAVTRRSVAHTHTDIGRVYQSHDRADLAEPLWQKAALLDPNNVDCRFYLAVLCEHQQKLLEALTWYEQIIRAEPANGAAYFLLGNLRMRLNQPEAAEKAFRKVIEVDPERPEGYRALARCYLQSHRRAAEARALAAQAVEIEPAAVNYFLLSSACESNDDRAGALAAIKRAVELDPGNGEYQRAYQRLMGAR